jgi:hypothetical protein
MILSTPIVNPGPVPCGLTAHKRRSQRGTELRPSVGWCQWGVSALSIKFQARGLSLTTSPLAPPGAHDRAGEVAFGFRVEAVPANDLRHELFDLRFHEGVLVRARSCSAPLRPP